MRRLLVCLIIVLSWQTVGAEPSSERVLDLGHLQIEGDVRMPKVRTLMPEGVDRGVFKEVSENLYEDFEEQLSEPSKLKEYP